MTNKDQIETTGLDFSPDAKYKFLLAESDDVVAFEIDDTGANQGGEQKEPSLTTPDDGDCSHTISFDIVDGVAVEVDNLATETETRDHRHEGWIDLAAIPMTSMEAPDLDATTIYSPSADDKAFDPERDTGEPSPHHPDPVDSGSDGAADAPSDDEIPDEILLEPMGRTVLEVQSGDDDDKENTSEQADAFVFEETELVQPTDELPLVYTPTIWFDEGPGDETDGAVQVQLPPVSMSNDWVYIRYDDPIRVTETGDIMYIDLV